MPTFIGYFLLQKPAALTAPQWTTTLQALRAILGKADNDDQPFKRLHVRPRLDGNAYIVAGTFDTADLDATDLTRLCKYISDALSGAFTPTQVRTGLQNNTQVFGGLAADWETSRQATVDFLIANSAQWEPATP